MIVQSILSPTSHLMGHAIVCFVCWAEEPSEAKEKGDTYQFMMALI